MHTSAHGATFSVVYAAVVVVAAITDGCPLMTCRTIRSTSNAMVRGVYDDHEARLAACSCSECSFLPASPSIIILQPTTRLVQTSCSRCCYCSMLFLPAISHELLQQEPDKAANMQQHAHKAATQIVSLLQARSRAIHLREDANFLSIQAALQCRLRLIDARRSRSAKRFPQNRDEYDLKLLDLIMHICVIKNSARSSETECTRTSPSTPIVFVDVSQ